MPTHEFQRAKGAREPRRFVGGCAEPAELLVVLVILAAEIETKAAIEMMSA